MQRTPSELKQVQDTDDGAFRRGDSSLRLMLISHVWKLVLLGRALFTLLSFVLKTQILYRSPKTLVVLTGGCFLWVFDAFKVAQVSITQRSSYSKGIGSRWNLLFKLS